MKKSELQQIIKEELGKVLSEATGSRKKTTGSITKHLSGRDNALVRAARELEEELMVADVDMESIADIVLDIIDLAGTEAVDDYKQSRDEF
jgi:uncharacterized protein YutE (UPF0331/DUF86 family)